MSVTISTLMRRKNGELVDYRAYTDAIRDPLYVEGAIVLDCNGIKVLDERMWDLVDQLWGYLIGGAEEVRHTGADNAQDATVSKDELLGEIAVKGPNTWRGSIER